MINLKKILFFLLFTCSNSSAVDSHFTDVAQRVNDLFSYQPVEEFYKEDYKNLNNEEQDFLTFHHLSFTLAKLINPQHESVKNRSKLIIEENKMVNLLSADIKEFLNKHKDNKKLHKHPIFRRFIENYKILINTKRAYQNLKKCKLEDTNQKDSFLNFLFTYNQFLPFMGGCDSLRSENLSQEINILQNDVNNILSFQNLENGETISESSPFYDFVTKSNSNAWFCL